MLTRSETEALIAPLWREITEAERAAKHRREDLLARRRQLTNDEVSTVNYCLGAEDAYRDVGRKVNALLRRLHDDTGWPTVDHGAASTQRALLLGRGA